MLKERILFGNLFNTNKPTLHLTTPYKHPVPPKCNAIDVIAARTRKNFSQFYSNFRNTKFEVTHTCFMTVDTNLEFQ